EGAHVVLAARGEEGLERIAGEIRAAGGRAELAPVDATDKEAVETHLTRVVASAGPVKAMFNAIGWADTQGSPLAGMEFERFFGAVRVALSTWFYTGTAMARHMGDNGGGAIVGITANAGRQAVAMTGGFSVACAAVEHFLRHLAVENGPRGVRACWVRSPG